MSHESSSLMLHFECANCGKRLKADRGEAGKPGKCPRCGQAIRVPVAVKPPPLPALIEPTLVASIVADPPVNPSSDLIPIKGTSAIWIVGGCNALLGLMFLVYLGLNDAELLPAILGSLIEWALVLAFTWSLVWAAKVLFSENRPRSIVGQLALGCWLI
jgi:DNA-directed RNA polymerase subunit RPC12/RpoP